MLRIFGNLDIWDSFLRWQSSSKQQIFFWHKPGLVWIEKYQLVEFVGNPLKISPILCGTPPHRSNLKNRIHIYCVLNLSFFTQYNELVFMLNLDKDDKKYDFGTEWLLLRRKTKFILFCSFFSEIVRCYYMSFFRLPGIPLWAARQGQLYLSASFGFALVLCLFITNKHVS